MVFIIGKPFPQTQIIHIAECPEVVTTFLGSPGELIEGKVEPPLANVTVVVDLGGEGQVTTYTDESGYYRLDNWFVHNYVCDMMCTILIQSRACSRW